MDNKKSNNLIYLFIFLLLFFITLIVFTVFVIPYRIFPGNVDNRAIFIAQIQTSVEIILIPIAIIGFILSIVEYRKNSFSPILQLFWASHDIDDIKVNTFSVEVDKKVECIEPLPFSVMLTNLGNSIATNYCIKISMVPIVFGVSIHSSDGAIKHNIPCEFYTDGTRWQINKSGELPIYPDFSTEIFSIKFPDISIPLEINDEYKFSYTIYTDKSDLISGTLILRFNIIDL